MARFGMRHCRLLTLALACSLLVAGCAGLGPSDPASEEPSAPTRWDEALSLLADGDEDLAAAEFVLLREESPAYRERAGEMLRQIREPIHEYFPPDHFNVRLREGQSLSSLSARYLGDPLRFYALARYNGIRKPDEVAVGQLIRIPMTEQARAVRRRETGSADTDDPIDDTTGLGAPAEAAAETESAQEDADGTGSDEDTASQAQDGAQMKVPADTQDDAGTDAGAGEASADRALPEETEERIKRLYREATIAFQRQDLEGTLRYCRQVLDLDPDHANCLNYRDRARELRRRLDRLEQEEREQAG